MKACNNPIERACRALALSHDMNPDDVHRYRYDEFGNKWPVSYVWQMFEREVRTVLAAIREPREAMIDEAYDSYNANGGSLRDVFMDMIDIALKPEPKP